MSKSEIIEKVLTRINKKRENFVRMLDQQFENYCLSYHRIFLENRPGKSK